MAVEQPALLDCGGEEAKEAYREEFRLRYCADLFRDVLQRVVEFQPGRWEHVCYKEKESDRYNRHPRDQWKQPRAIRIPWIGATLKDPQVIKKASRFAGREVYVRLFCVGTQWERFCVVVEVEALNLVKFITAYPMDESTWLKMREDRDQVYPTPRPKKRKRH